MTDDFPRDPSGDEIEDLLPLYAADRLGSRDRARVEMALAVDADLARRLELIRAEMAAAKEAASAPPEPGAAPVAAGTEPVASPAAAEAAVVAEAPVSVSAPEPAPPPVEPADPAPPTSSSPLLRFIEDFGPRRLVLAGLVTIGAIALVEAVLIGSALLRDPDGVAATEATGSTLVVVGFTPEAKIGNVSAFLTRHAAQVVDGPRADGTFALRVSGSDAAAIAEAMRQERDVVNAARPSPRGD